MKLLKSGLVGKLFGPILLLSIIIAFSGCASAEVKGARDGDLNAVRKYVESGGDVNLRQSRGRTLLMFASAGGHVHIIDYLMSVGADLRIRDDRGYSALIYGTEANKNNSVTSLLSHGASVNDISSSGQSSLLLAAMRNYSGIVTTLLNKGADYNLADNKGWTPFLAALNHSASSPSGVTYSFTLIQNEGASLSVSSSSGSTSPYKLVESDETSSSTPSFKLVRDEEIPPRVSSSPVSSPQTDAIALTAVKTGNKDVLSILFLEGINPNLIDGAGNSLLHYALNRVEMVQFLFTWNLDLNIRNSHGETPLLSAVKDDFTKSISLLIEEGAEINMADNKGWTPILSALKRSASSPSGLTQSAILLQREGALLVLPSALADSITFTAVQSGNLDVLTLLFQKGTNPLIRDNQGNSLLHFGVPDTELVSFLLSWNVDPDGRNKTEETPLSIAVNGGYAESVTLLLKEGADPELRYNNGSTVLHMAAQSQSPEILNILLLYGVNIFATDKGGSTALHSAAKGGVPESVRKLLLSGIFVNSADSTGLMPYDLSFQNKTYGEEIRVILATAGAIIPQEPADEIAEPQEETEVTEAETDEVSHSGEMEKPAETVPVSIERVVRFSWPKINPSVAKEWNNSDKLTGEVTLILKDPAGNILLSEDILVPMKGVNADAYQLERTLTLESGKEYRGVLIFKTDKDKVLKGQITAEINEQNLLFVFEEFEYE